MPCRYAIANVFNRYKLEKDRIINDLIKDRPLYILSAYGPERELPIQLFGGYPREQSFEELRLRHYELAYQGNQQQAIQEAQNWFNSAEQQIRTALNNIDGAIKYIIDGENEHPNRIDICNGTGATTANTQNPVGSQQKTPAFGQSTSSSGLGPFSSPAKQQPAFSQQQPLTGQGAAFGQPAELGRPTTSFGQPTALAPSFGQPSKPISTFGQPTTSAPAFGQPSAPRPAFGQPSAPSAFNQGSSLGQQPPQGFGAPSVLGSNQASTSGFAQVGNLFSQPSAPSQPSAFGEPSTGPANAFGQQTASSITKPFSQPATAATTNPFAKPAAAPAPAPFSQPATSSNEPLTKPFGQSTISQATVQSQQTYATFSGDRLKSWKGKPVDYVDNVPCIKSQDGGIEKVLFPNGAPALTKSPELPDEMYDEGTKEDYRFMRRNGFFKNGIMPNLPPKRIWCKWDF